MAKQQRKTTNSKPKHNSQFHLLCERRFLPFFCTQFLGAFNDNLFKNIIILLIAYQSTAFTSIDSDVMNNLAAGLFIIPFFLFSSLAGQLADKFEKSRLIQILKCVELVVMCLTAIAFYFQSLWGLLIILFLMGSQSAFFGPVKYSIIPQHLSSNELISGNALVEMGTFLAILFGTIGAGFIMQNQTSYLWICLFVCMVSLIGLCSSLLIPASKPAFKSLNINYNPWKTTLEIIGYAYAKPRVFWAIIGISWFWFLGASYLIQIPNYSIEILSASESVVTLLLCVFSVGIGVGSMLCDRISRHRIEIGIVPLGSLGLSIFGIDLYLASDFPVVIQLRTLADFLLLQGAVRVLIDITAIGVFGGFFIVPLYALVQQLTPCEHRARVIAANNILNALFMVIAAIFGVLLLQVIGLNKAEYFMVLALMNILIVIIIYIKQPIFITKFIEIINRFWENLSISIGMIKR